MKYIPHKIIFRKLIILTAGLLFSCQDNIQKSNSDEKKSSPGVYSGYSEAIYAEDYIISSEYVEMRDGNKIAVDLYRPKDKKTGELIEERLPVLWMHTPYNRRYNGETTEALTVENYAGKAGRLVQYGYVVATADFRGLYASYGHNEAYNRGEWVGAARNDAYDITEWLAKQPWSNGKIGMWGCSATGGSQMQAASTAPPSLKAIFPMSFEFDVYSFRVPGGISGSRAGGTSNSEGMTAQQKRDQWAAAVDEDIDSLLLKDAIAGHAANIESAGNIPFRDGVSQDLKNKEAGQWWIHSSPATYLEKINNSGIAMYMAANWNEGYTKHGPFVAFNNITTPRKLIVGPATHCDWSSVLEMTNFDITIEERRFFDYWLKGIDNGIMDEEPVYYYTYNAEENSRWRSAPSWPLPDENRTRFYLGKGALQLDEPISATGEDLIQVTYESDSDTTGVIVYETDLLEDPIRVTGHPEINLWVSSTHDDGDFIATIQDVFPDGTVKSYNVQGQLRASNRILAEPKYNNLNLPYHSFSKDQVKPLTPGEPTLLQFAILPTSILFKENHKIRLVLSFATRGTPKIEPAPQITIYHNKKYPSYLTLPIIKN